MIAAAVRVLNSDDARVRSDARGISRPRHHPRAGVDEALARIE
jgi:hypothetical protein